MSFYQKIIAISEKHFRLSKILKFGFNYLPMYRRSTAKIVSISDDLTTIKIKLPISYKNKNFVGTIFGGSMFSAVDPIPMTQLIQLLGKEYVVWDKAAAIRFKRPGNVDLYATFSISEIELKQLKEKVRLENEMEYLWVTQLTNKEETTVYCEVEKTIYIASKMYYKEKQKSRSKNTTA